MRRKAFAAILAIAGLLTAAASVQADDWGPFWQVSNNVSVSFVRVDSTTYAWKFRNDAYNTVKYMKYTYSYVDADSGRYRTDVDYLPGRLSPGGVFGGWAAFSANSRVQPTIRIVEIERE